MRKAMRELDTTASPMDPPNVADDHNAELQTLQRLCVS